MSTALPPKMVVFAEKSRKITFFQLKVKKLGATQYSKIYLSWFLATYFPSCYRLLYKYNGMYRDKFAEVVLIYALLVSVKQTHSGAFLHPLSASRKNGP